jgi:two-component sensor histidine kinase
MVLHHRISSVDLMATSDFPTNSSSESDESDQITALRSQNAELTRQLQHYKSELEHEKKSHEQTKSQLSILKEWLNIASEADGIAVWSYSILTQETTLSTQGYNLYGLESGTFEEDIIPFPSYKHPFDAFFDWVHPEDRELVRQADEEALQTGKFKAEFRSMHPDGKVCWIYSVGKVSYDENGEPSSVHGVEFDITDRKQVEEQLRNSLQEKEILLKEIHHRVKNNLQIISSLLSLQTRSIEDPQILALFQNTQNRVETIALLHEHLYQSPNLAKINFSSYLQQLVTHIFATHGSCAKHVQFNIDAAAIELNLDMALPCSLIVNELITNSLKHAFPDDRVGEVGIRFTINPQDQYVLTIWDNGIGLPDEEISSSNSLGIRLVKALVRQLKGTVETGQFTGNLFKLVFPRLE